MLESIASELPKPRGICIDLDDTLVCFDGVSVSAWRTVCGAFTEKHPEVDTEKLIAGIRSYSSWYYGDPERHKVGRNRLHETRRDIVKVAFERLRAGSDAQAVEVADAYSELRAAQIYLFPMVHETLDWIRQKGIGLLMITNGEAVLQRAKIERFGLERHFDCILIEGELGYGKPDPRIYRDALTCLGTDTGNTWIIGDNISWEVEIPKQLGFTCIWNDFRRSGIPEQILFPPDRVISQFTEVRNLLEEVLS